jgi:hypothetical protein
VPDYATIASAILCIVLVVIIDVKDLIGFTDISGFLTYSSVAMGLLVVRYYDNGIEHAYTSTSNREELVESSLDTNSDRANNNDYATNRSIENSSINTVREDETSNLLQVAGEDCASTTDLIASYTNNDMSGPFSNRPTQTSCLKRFRKLLYSTGVFKYKQNALSVIILLYLSNVAIFGLMHNLVTKSKLILIVIAVGVNLIAGVFLSLFEQTRMPSELAFKTPLVPLVPILAIVVNTYLMMASEYTEWIVFAIVIISGEFF